MSNHNRRPASSGGARRQNVSHGEAVAAARLLVKIQAIKGTESDARLLALAQEHALPSPAFRPSRREAIAAAKALARSRELHGLPVDARVAALAQLDDELWQGTPKVDSSAGHRNGSPTLARWLSGSFSRDRCRPSDRGNRR